MGQQVGVNTSAHFAALGPPLGELFLVFGRTLPGRHFFLFNLRSFGLGFQFRSLHVVFPGFGVDHELKNLVFSGTDFLLGELDFMHQRLVLLVGLHVEGLVAVL